MASRTYKPNDPEAQPFEELRKKNLEKPKPLKKQGQPPPSGDAAAKKEE